MPSPLMLKLIGGLAAALMLLTLVLDRNRWMHRAHGDETQIATICASVRAAADNPKMDCKLAAQQIGLLGQAITDLKAGISKQNAAVNALAVESDRQKAAASQAVQKALGRASAAQATATRLAASARSGGAPAGSAAACKPSKALQDAWR